MINYKDKSPNIHETCYIAKGAELIGDVFLDKHVNVWFNAVLRGDLDSIVVGENSNVQDGSIIHCDTGEPTIIGKNVTIGHNSIIHGCTIEDNCLIGMGVIIMNGAHIGKNCLIAAGTLIPQGKVIEDNSLVMGNPGQVMRKVISKDIQAMKKNVEIYLDLSKEYKK